MEDYWRMCMGISNTPNLPHPKSIDFDDLDADDFSDVFGGPPRSVLYRKYSGEITEWASFYDEAFRPLEFSSCYSTKGGRSLPSFNIPTREKGFNDDVFRSVDDLRRSSCELPKSDCPSVRSWEKLNHVRPTAVDDIGLTPKFRWNSTTMVADQEQISPFPFNNENIHMENEHEKLKKSSPYYGFCKHASSPEMISLESSFRSIKMSADELELNSPSSPTSCSHREPDTRGKQGCYAQGTRGKKVPRVYSQMMEERKE